MKSNIYFRLTPFGLRILFSEADWEWLEHRQQGSTGRWYSVPRGLIQNFRTRKESLIALLKRSSIGAEESKRHDKPSHRVTAQSVARCHSGRALKARPTSAAWALILRSDVLSEMAHESGSGGRIMIGNEGTSYVPGRLPGSRVWAAKLPTASYSEQEDVALPELSAVTPTSVMTAVRSLFEVAPLDRERFGSEDWNPLAELIRQGIAW